MHRRFAAAALITAVLVAACGGAAASPSVGGPGSSSGPGGPDATAGPGGSLPVLPSGLVIPSFDPGAILQNLEGVDSYRVAMTTDGELSYSAVVVTKPVLSRDITVDDQHFDLVVP